MYYVIQVKSGKEDKTIKEIKDRLDKDLAFDVFVPKAMRRRKYQGEWHDELKPCFPGYIFIDTSNIKNVFKALYYVPSFTKILGREGLSENFLPLNVIETRMIDILYNKDSNYIASISNITFEEGDKIVVLSGPLYGQEANIKKVNLHKRLVTITITLGGQSVEAELGIDFISPLN